MDRAWILRRTIEIKQYYDRRLKETRLISTRSGGLLSIFYFLYSREFQDQGALQTAFRLKDEVEREALNSPKSTSIFWGPLEAYIVLRIWKELGYDSQVYELRLPRLRQRAFKALERWVKGSYPELINGTVGVALSAQAQGNKALLGLCVGRMRDSFQQTNGGQGFVWADPGLPEPLQKIYRQFKILNLGMAHGIAGVLTFLSFLEKQGHKSRPMKSMSAALYKSLSQVERKSAARGMPTMYPWPDPKAVAKTAQSAWCYGDPGIGFALLASGGRRDRLSRKLLQRGTNPKKWGAPIVDEHFCHGAAGIAQICRRSYQRTGRSETRDRYLFWLRKLNGPRGSWRFVKMSHPERCPEESLLFGYLGIGLTLLSALSEDDANWDRHLLLSEFSKDDEAASAVRI